jgi:hypothetical protein
MLGGLMTLGAACWLCIYPVGLVLAGLVVLVLVPQGNELLEATARHDDAAFKAMFHAAVAAWALSAWYCSRILLQHRFDGRFASAVLASDEGFVRLVRIWLPRLLGAAIYVCIAAHFFFVARERADGAVVLALGIAYWLFVVYRRRVLLRGQGDAALRSAALSRTTRAVLAVSLALSAALLAGFLASDVELPRRLGGAPIILLAFSSWILFGSIVLVLLPKAYGLPSLALLPLFLVVMAGGVDNHEVRQLPPQPAQRAPSIKASALEWLKLHEAEFRRARADGHEWFPVYIASAEGGGLRAAYWTGSVLGELEAATEGRFSRRLFAISSVSGGSLGAAAFVAELAPEVDCNTPDPVSVRNCVRYFLKGDFLAPMVAYMLFPDLLQRFIPMPIRKLDRARALEHAWEASWAQTHPRAPANPFAAHYEAVAVAGVPRLFLNSARVETGKRVLVSPARFDEDELPEVDDLLAIGGRRWSMPLSTAVHVSARFAYVSPAAKICKDAGETCDADGVWGRLVDGGYHENSGAQTAEGLLRALRRAAREFEAAQPPGRTRIQPQVVIITNDANSVRLCDYADATQPVQWYAELLSPLAALWNARTARGGQARRALADAAAGYQRDPLDKDCEADGTRARTLEFAVGSKGGTERPPALGWLLATGSIQRMDQALCREEHARAFATARRDLGVSGDYACR